jgi:hypothetical protein
MPSVLRQLQALRGLECPSGGSGGLVLHHGHPSHPRLRCSAASPLAPPRRRGRELKSGRLVLVSDSGSGGGGAGEVSLLPRASGIRACHLYGHQLFDRLDGSTAPGAVQQQAAAAAPAASPAEGGCCCTCCQSAAPAASGGAFRRRMRTVGPHSP